MDRMKIVLINPNTDARITAKMCQIASRSAPAGMEIVGLTAPFGAPLIVDETTLDEAAAAVTALVDQLQDQDGVIVAAFGDPGLEILRERLSCAVVGIAEAAMQAAAAEGRRFAVVTTTPDLRQAIARRAAAGHHAQFVGTWVTPADPQQIMTDPSALVAALELACHTAISESGAEAVIIGGGPLAQAAESLRHKLSVPLIAPIPEAVQLLLSRISEDV